MSYKKPKLKMHLIFRWDLSPAVVAVAAAHAGLGTYLQWKDDPIMMEWERTSFVKILHATYHQEHWDYCKTLGEHRVFTESTLNHLEVCLGFRVVENPNHLFKEVPLWSPNVISNPH